MRATTTATVEAPTFANPSEYIDSGFTIHHCGMFAHLRASGLSRSEFSEQAIAHSSAVVTALMNGKPVPVHEAPGIQLVAVSLAQETIRRGAEQLVGDFGADLETLEGQAAARHISAC